MANGREEDFVELINEAGRNADSVNNGKKVIKVIKEADLNKIEGFDFGEGFDLDQLDKLDKHKRCRGVATFLMWKASQDHRDFKTMVNKSTNSLDRGVLCAGADFGRPALRQNPIIAGLLARLEANLRKAGVLPELVKKEQSTGPQKHDQKAKSNEELNRYSKFLQQRVTELEAEVDSLKLKLSRYESIESALSSLGRMPR